MYSLICEVCLQGLVKPDIVFFGEDLPARFHSLQRQDFAKCDLLVIMGTSLEVYACDNHVICSAMMVT